MPPIPLLSSHIRVAQRTLNARSFFVTPTSAVAILHDFLIVQIRLFIVQAESFIARDELLIVRIEIDLASSLFEFVFQLSQKSL